MTTETESFLGVSPSESKTGAESAPRYPALRIVAGVYRVLAILTGIAAVIIIAVGIRALEDGSNGIILVAAGALGGLIGVVTNLAAAEGIRVFLDIEENTRNAYYCLWKALNNPQ